MKVICTTERKIEIEKTCRMEYCCKRMEAAMIDLKGKSSYDRASSDFRRTDTGVSIQTHSGYRCNSHHEEINFCPWCATPVKIENIKVDNTGLPPKEPTPPEPVKKKHWWNL